MSGSAPQTSHRDIASIMFAETEPLLRERRRLRARIRELRDLCDEHEVEDENHNGYKCPATIEARKLERRDDEISDTLSDHLLAAFGHAILSVSEAS